MSSLLSVEGIGEKFAAKLKEAGVTSTDVLLQKGSTPKGRKELAEQTGISEKLILEWVNHVDLFRIKGVGEEYADLLEEAGVDTVVELAQRNPENLYNKLVEINAAKKLVRKMPVKSQVEDWIEQAKSLPRVITY
jgi:predicted flap endonuclease-1-like 5' DNA nuclease